MSLVSGPGRGGGREEGRGGTEELFLCTDLHVKYIQGLDTRKDELEYWKTEQLRVNGIYWGLTACFLLGHPQALPHPDVIAFLATCWNAEDGGFGAAPGHDSHMLYTVSATQVLCMVDTSDWSGFEKHVKPRLREAGDSGRVQVARFLAALQDRKTGTFAGDRWGETDTRFLYGAVNALSLLGQLDLIDKDAAVAYIRRCINIDGGFGSEPGAESHAGQIFTCVGALTILGRPDLIDKDKLGAWLSERQRPNGALNGRPEKLEDVCYSWWAMSSMSMVGRLHWIDGDALAKFILKCQDTKYGGISDRPGDMVDVYHTVFGIAGLSLLGWPGVQEVDARYCMPREVTKRILGD